MQWFYGISKNIVKNKGLFAHFAEKKTSNQVTTVLVVLANKFLNFQ